MVNVLYSLVDVNRRFDRLALDSLYIRVLDMTIITTMNSLYDQTSSTDAQVLSKICEKILPRIHHQVQKLTVEQYSMKHVLDAANYPELYSLSLINFQKEILYKHLTDDLILRDILSKQITHLNIDIKNPAGYYSSTILKIFGLILSLCKKLIVLNFCDMFPTRTISTLLFHLRRENSLPSTLIKLKINGACVTDCLYLLDGPLVCLSTLIINVSSIVYPIGKIDSTKKLLKLKCFSFTSCDHTFKYDTLIVPLLCRMINLEELRLYLSVGRCDSTYIDGIQLYDQFLIYMTQLNKFTFNIKTTVYQTNVSVELPSNEDIQRSFIGRDYQEVASYIKTTLFGRIGECHIYSLPYEFEYFNLDNSFQGGMFHKVRQLTMNDTIPFKHKLFKLISQGFPFLKFLYIINNDPLKDKQHSSTLITFPYLTFLDLTLAHLDYAELFLLEKTMHLPRLLNLAMQYESLTTITNNFTTNAIYFNFGKLISLDICPSFVRPENFRQYFPLL
ncbi:unnamed protein product [Rotaria sp. Silwood1]|nr:unnamed protein product [Rotaria sp. Silwood1]CAF4595157.1 unnamed protein product [Rotaria sp. Silwood1]CAF4595173.1 unnamed protein product [Rotaria sp. Silwood1]